MTPVDEPRTHMSIVEAALVVVVWIAAWEGFTTLWRWIFG